MLDEGMKEFDGHCVVKGKYSVLNKCNAKAIETTVYQGSTECKEGDGVAVSKTTYKFNVCYPGDHYEHFKVTPA